MSIEVKNEYGKIDITNDVIARVVGESAIECYGIVGMASKTSNPRWFNRNSSKRKFYTWRHCPKYW